MFNFTNKSNQVMENLIEFYPREYYLLKAGSTWWSDSISLFVVPIILITGIFANLFGFMVLQISKEFQLKLYFYLKIYFLNSFVTNLLGILYGFTNSRRYISFSNTYFSMFYICKIGGTSAITCYTLNNLLDIYLTLERLSIFNRRLSYLNEKIIKKPWILCLISAIYSIIINIPFYLTYQPNERVVYLSSNESYLFVDYTLSDFSISDVGVYLIYLEYAVRDILPLALLILFNFILIYYFRRYLKNKVNLVAIGAVEKPIEPNNTTTTSVNIPPAPTIATVVNQDNNLILNARKKEIKTTLMVLFICGVSIIKTGIIIASIVLPYIEIGLLSILFATFANYSIFTAATLNFFLVYFFDSKFKTAFNKPIKKIFSQNTDN